MKSITPLKINNMKPTIVVSHKCLEAIKHIVSIAPEEAQWFHTVEIVKPNEHDVYLQLSDKLYIPKQNTSAAQVDSTPSMMIEFFNDLKEEYKDLNIVNDKLTKMTCWCHSHHNMAPNPSLQDNKQFTQNIEMNLNQQIYSWQIMLIFNKKNQFYSRVRDPYSGIIFEGVDIVVTHQYDFSYINEAAREKFLKPKLKPFAYSSSFKKGWGSFTRSSNLSKALDYYEEEEVDILTSSSIVDDIVLDLYPFDEPLTTSKARFKTKQEALNAIESLDCHFDEKEMNYLYYLITKQPKKCLTVFTDRRYEKNALPHEHIRDEILNYLLTTNQSFSTFKDTLRTVLDIGNLNTLTDAKCFLGQI